MTDAQQQDEPSVLSAEIDFTGPYSLNEIIEIEALCGERMAVLLEERSGTFMRVAVWVVARRANPGTSLSEAGEVQVKLGG